MRTTLTRLLALLPTSLLACVAIAADGAIPLHAPASISESGFYRLTRDIDTTASPVFTINAADVTIDLAGHSISAAGSIAFALNANTTTLRVNNGSLRAQYGFYSYMKTKVRVEVSDLDLTTTSSGYGFYLNAEALALDVERLRFEAVSATRAILYQAESANQERVSIRDSSFDTTSSGTIYLFNPIGVRFENNVIRGHGYASASPALHISPAGAAESALVRGNEVLLSSSSGHGIVIGSLDSALVEDNLVVVPGTGIEVHAGTSMIRGNTVHGGSVCIEGSLGALVTGNALGGCSTGLYANGSSVVYKDNYFRATDAVWGSAIDGGGNIGH